MKRVVFCDFDGTITAIETFVAMLKRFTPALTEQLLPEIYALRLSLREGVRQLLESIPSHDYPEMLEFGRSHSIRPGFGELLDFLDGEGVPLVVVSGGVQGIVEAVLGPLTQRVAAVYGMELDCSGDYLRASSPFEEDSELVSKVRVMAHHPADESIIIGDSVTDLQMALHAPVVFARDRLAQYLDEREKPYIPWTDFFSIRESLQTLWHPDVSP